MQRCPQCNQLYSDEYLLCVRDGARLTYDVPVEATVMRPIQVMPLSGQPVRRGVSPTFVYLAIGLVALLAGAAIIILTRDASNRSPNSPTNATTSQLEEENKRKEEARLDVEKARLQAERDKLEEEKQKLADEKARIERQKNQPVNTSTQSSSNISRAGAAIVFAPPSNVRVVPKGAILCSVVKKTTIRIFGIYDGPNAYDEDGVWVYTDVCGSRGVIHSSQIRF